MLHQVQTGRSPEETRTRILTATRQLLAKKGRRGTTTREIAELAGVNEATLFRHFGHKDALINACVQHFCGTGELQELLGEFNGDIEADLYAIARALSERMEQLRDLIVVTLSEEETDTPVDQAAWRTPQVVRRIVADYMAKRVQNGELEGDPLLLARFFMGMIFAQVIGRKKFAETDYTTDELIRFQISTFLNGVRKR
jgi:AcrR family transcriptional regulator